MQYYNQDTLPATVQQVASFIAHLSVKGRAPATIATYVSAISYQHKIMLHPDPTNNFLIKKLLEGTKRATGNRTDLRRPITYELLVQLLNSLQHICNNAFETALFRGAFALAFFAFLRVGEFTAKNKSADTSCIIQRTDVSFAPNSLSLTIRHAKNNQRNKPIAIEIVGLQEQQRPYCPVELLSQYLKQQPNNKAGPLFQHFDHSPLTRFQFIAVLDRAVKFCRLDSIHYKSHSFRIGAASSCAVAGVPTETIKRWGRWHSSAYQTYIRPPTQVMAQSFLHV